MTANCLQVPLMNMKVCYWLHSQTDNLATPIYVVHKKYAFSSLVYRYNYNITYISDLNNKYRRQLNSKIGNEKVKNLKCSITQ